MSCSAEPTSPVSKRSTSPRPPAVGEEVKKFHDTSQRYSEPYKNWNMEYQSRLPHGEYVNRSVTPSCPESVTELAECTENFPNPSPPPPYKWAQNLLYLLEDIQGVSLFRQFLKQEGQETRSLSFWFACRGVKLFDPEDRDGLIKLINVVFEKKAKRISAISVETKDEIRRKLSLNIDIDDTIFDVAQREVEAYMMKTTYPNFLRSDIYIQLLGGLQNEVSTDIECTVSPEPVDFLPTVHEDSELQFMCNNIPFTKNNVLQKNKISNLLQRSKVYVSKVKPEGPAGFLKSPYSHYSSYHSKYGSYLPASAQDSELQSLSSDALTDDTMSLADSGVDIQSKQKRSQKAFKRSDITNKDSPGIFIPRTQRLPQATQQTFTPKEFHTLLVKRLNKVFDEQRSKEKMNEKLKSLESAECPKPEATCVRSSHKSNTTPSFESGFFGGPSEENVQDILDQHISRVFDSGQQTPSMSTGCLSPPPAARPNNDALDRSSVPMRSVSSCEQPQDLSVGTSHKHSLSQFAVPTNVKHRRDHDTHSTDSTMVDYVSDDNMPSSYRSQYSSMANSELAVDYSRRSREHSKRYINKKFSSMTDSSSSCKDSGIGLTTCDSIPSYSKVTYWLETKRMSDQEKEHMWRNSSTSPVLSRSSFSRKAAYNSSRSGNQEAGSSQWSAISSHIVAQDPSIPSFPPDTTSNLLEARRILDENKAKLKLKCASGGRSSHDTSRLKYSKGYDSFDDGICHRKLSRKSCPTAFEAAPTDLTAIGYCYGRHSVPYLSKLPGKNITLGQFKSLLSKKGKFRYFFKTASNDFGTGVVFEEVTDDCKVLPLWEGKVFCVIESMDDNSTV